MAFGGGIHVLWTLFLVSTYFIVKELTIGSVKQYIQIVTKVKVHDSQAYINMEMTRECISFTLESRKYIFKISVSFCFFFI